jgi:hypothetical protein
MNNIDLAQLDTILKRLYDVLPASPNDVPDDSRELWDIYEDLRQLARRSLTSAAPDQASPWFDSAMDTGVLPDAAPVHDAAAPSAEQAMCDSCDNLASINKDGSCGPCIECLEWEAEMDAETFDRRAQFERWASGGAHVTMSHVFSFTRHPNLNRYLEWTTEICWRVWRAATALSAGAAAKTDHASRDSDKSFLQWIHDRLRFVHAENENYDYMHKLRAIIAAMSGNESTPNAASAAGAGSERDDSVLRTAHELTLAIWRGSWADVSPNFEPLQDLPGLLSQIDNMTSGMVRAPSAAVQDERASTDAEFLSKRLARVAKLVGAPIPEHFTHEQVAETAGTILGEIARKLEARAAHPVQDGEKDAK